MGFAKGYMMADKMAVKKEFLKVAMLDRMTDDKMAALKDSMMAAQKDKMLDNQMVGLMVLPLVQVSSQISCHSNHHQHQCL